MINRRNMLKIGASLPVATVLPAQAGALLASPQSMSGVSPFMGAVVATAERIAVSAIGQGIDPAPAALFPQPATVPADAGPHSDSLASWRDGYANGAGI